MGRLLPTVLIQRLEEIASHHNGKVPFHGRLFAQWMHHAYPRECSYPHLAGTLNPRTPLEYETQTSEKVSLNEEAMRRQIVEMARVPEQDIELPWNSEEELFVSRQKSH